jgi:hypothetical protein
MEEIKKQHIRKILPLIFISVAILMLVIHLVIQIIETNNPAEETSINQRAFPEISAESIKADSIWHNTEFIQD